MQLGVVYLKLTTQSIQLSNPLYNQTGWNFMSEKFSFGASSVMREVPPGQTAVIKFNGKAEKVETDWGDKFSYQILIYSHPSYESIPNAGIESVWQSKSQASENLFTALSQGIKELTKAYEEEKWELIRSQEGVYFLQQL